jgi:hypothetical protein
MGENLSKTEREKLFFFEEHEGNNAKGDWVYYDTGKDFFLFYLYLTLAPNFSGDVTRNTSPHRGNTRSGYLVKVRQDVSVHQPSSQG